MEISSAVSISTRPCIGTRRMGKKLCLTNPKLREAWVCAGSSPAIWQELRKGATAEQIAALFHERYNVPADKVRSDVLSFILQLWERRLVDVPGLEHVTDDERAKLVTEEPHNRSGRVVDAAFAAEVMFRCTFDLLIPCNLRCRHCYLDFSEKDILPLEEVCSYLDQLAQHGCPELAFTGGEIFLRHDLLEILEHAENLGFMYDLLTNGNFITKEKADQLSRFSPLAVQISLYGTTAEIHERITRQPGTYEKSTKAARLLIERGIPVRLAYFIQQDNFEDSFGAREFAEKMGAKCEFDTKLVPNRNGSKDLLRFGVSVQQQAELYQRGLMKRETNFTCTAAAAKSRITARGDVFPCELINTVSMGNLKRQSLAEIWGAPSRRTLRNHILGYKPNRCGGCSHTSDCEPCAAMRGYNQDGHMEAPISEACLMTTASLLAQGRDTPEAFQAFTSECVQNAMTESRTDKLVQIINARILPHNGLDA